ncbi:MAG: tRNA (N(6)-L-threonylcarbamoyladenosine(37)-C(2))-methylthiotransferase MtaB [Candidatus Koribacter versatilis]|uniref:tRNA (N(6)-L-threonylcarbamoyladenosine(37)-C(2))-methylthiotransferase MtaB n=1 Tax=Candidatus Korobacter versatilis TaxID=658062 RepID=A0A932ABQ6_9BACT|nr:tRNA (N(6)-L-threonylcarbamoyladenosine(37)-C(2))-methylthiotransferase MtaB [Candidatus Koribacter versatilis]
MSSYYVYNFGCRATQADGAELERQFASQGLQAAPSEVAADVVVLNTCTVTEAADKDARAAIRRVHRENPAARIVVTGCYAQRAPEELAALPGVSTVVGNSHKHRLAKLVAPAAFVPLASLHQPPPVHVSDIFAHTELLAAPVFDSEAIETAAGAHAERTRPNLKIQDGCDNRCSFCVIPFVRGQSRSLPLPRVLAEVNALIAHGYREVVLSGINLGRWGNDFDRAEHFEALIRAVLAETSLEKLRLSSIEPMDWSDELIALVATSPRLAKHVHAPLQSGSDRVLRAMHRKYRPWHYAERIQKARAAMPHAAIGADVMVGFPGETEELFEESRAFIALLPFTYLHVFTYSPRPGTPAADLPGQVPEPVKRERNRILRALAAEKNRAFRASFIGRELDAITLSRRSGDETEALTDNYLRLRLVGDFAPNQWWRARIQAVTQDGLRGTAVQPAL